MTILELKWVPLSFNVCTTLNLQINYEKTVVLQIFHYQSSAAAQRATFLLSFPSRQHLQSS